MQFSTVEIRFIVTTLLYSTFANDLKRNFFFRKMFIVTEYAALMLTVTLRESISERQSYCLHNNFVHVSMSGSACLSTF